MNVGATNGPALIHIKKGLLDVELSLSGLRPVMHVGARGDALEAPLLVRHRAH